MTSNESERISLRAAMSERAERLRIAAKTSIRGKSLRATYAEKCAANIATLEVDSLKSQLADLRAQLLENLNAALAERAERLRAQDEIRDYYVDQCATGGLATVDREIRAIKAQIRDLETEKHALLQEMS